jgi:nucleoside-diphosphate-sugar epimerase
VKIAFTGAAGRVGSAVVDHLPAHARSQEILIRVTVAFFQKFLCGRTEPVLDHPRRFYPEIEDRTHVIGS